ncbi:hypothetical protein SLA2020_093530 [Shorea laevis]
MAKTLGIILLCFLLLLVSLEIQGFWHWKFSFSVTETRQPCNGKAMYGATQGSLHPQECAPRCTARCSATAYKRPCMFFCQKCCAKCLCVPPGTYGNKQSCPCYNNWKTKKGGPKCP